MGYTTEFSGTIKLNKKLDKATHEFLVKFNQTRRMARNVDKKYGVEGEFYVDGKGAFGQDCDSTVIDSNRPPKTQPGLWCQWVPTDDGMGIVWDGSEKFYSSAEWMVYIIDKILAPKGYVCNGTIEAQGEDTSDHWYLIVNNNVVSTESVDELLKYKERVMIYETPRKELPLLINHTFLSEDNRILYNNLLKNNKGKKKNGRTKMV